MDYFGIWITYTETNVCCDLLLRLKPKDSRRLSFLKSHKLTKKKRTKSQFKKEKSSVSERHRCFQILKYVLTYFGGQFFSIHPGIRPESIGPTLTFASSASSRSP